MDRGRRASREDLVALTYHRDVADWLERHEPAGWAAVSAAAAVPADAAPDDAAQLRRSAHRLEPAAHPAVHAALARASENVGVDRPVSVYRSEGARVPNAALLALPDELAVVLSGNLLPVLSEPGLCAVVGHELAHHVFGTLEGGRYATAGRLLDVLAVDAGTPPPYLETARRYRLATELFADRGAVVACGDLHAAIGALVATVTGSAEVDPAAYLAQAQATGPAAGSPADSRPETVLRAWALGRWHADPTPADLDGPGAGELDAGELAARALLRPRLDLDRLDLFDRADLERATRALIEGLLLDPQWHSEPLLAHARQFFPDLAPADPGRVWGSPGAGVRPVPAGAAPATLRYLGYVLLDLVTADPDADLERSVAAALRFAAAAGLAVDFDKVARAELALSAAAWRRIGAPATQVPG